MTQTLSTNFSEDLLLATTPQERLLTVLAEWRYRQPVKDEGKDYGAHSSVLPFIYIYNPSEKSPGRHSDLYLYL